MNNLIKVFDSLKRDLDHMREHGTINELMIHDLIVRPILIHPDILNWSSLEVLSQQNFIFPKEIEKSYIWEGAIPKKRIPDIIINSLGYEKEIAIIEEKNLQESLKRLKGYTPQLSEYMQLYNVVWGILTDGEKWIIKRNHELFLEFKDLNELQEGILDFKKCIGKRDVSKRLQRYGTTDLVIVKLENIIVASGNKGACPMSLSRIAIDTPGLAGEIMMNLSMELLDLTIDSVYFKEEDKQYLQEESYKMRSSCALISGIAMVFDDAILLTKTESEELRNHIIVRFNNWLESYSTTKEYINDRCQSRNDRS